ncbi:MAG: response regulator [Pseudobdellovibrionaceae bacterium]
MSNKKILVVDDTQLIRTMVSRTLNELGYLNVHEAIDGDEAKQKIIESFKQNQPFDLIISDWKMPKSTGLDLLQFVRQSEEGKKISFVMLTVESEKSSIVSAVNEGIDAYLFKPFKKEELKVVLAKVAARK